MMGDYGLYVWSAYGITVAVFAINIIFCFQERRRVKKLYDES